MKEEERETRKQRKKQHWIKWLWKRSKEYPRLFTAGALFIAGNTMSLIYLKLWGICDSFAGLLAGALASSLATISLAYVVCEVMYELGKDD